MIVRSYAVVVVIPATGRLHAVMRAAQQAVWAAIEGVTTRGAEVQELAELAVFQVVPGRYDVRAVLLTSPMEIGDNDRIALIEDTLGREVEP